MKRLLTILPVLTLMVAGCNPDPFADFIIEPNPAYVGEDILFTNVSDHAQSAEWTMGDGSVSSAYNVTHFYYDPGFYNVTLKAFGKRSGVSTLVREVEVIGSELKIEVRDYDTDVRIEGASVVLFATLDDWFDADYDNIVNGKEEFTNSAGVCYFDNLSYQEYYVDVYYRVGNEGYVNWLLGEEDVFFIETQQLPGGFDHTFIAYVEPVTFDEKKSATTSTGRPVIRPPLRDPGTTLKSAGAERNHKENKFSEKRTDR